MKKRRREKERESLGRETNLGIGTKVLLRIRALDHGALVRDRKSELDHETRLSEERKKIKFNDRSPLFFVSASFREQNNSI